MANPYKLGVKLNAEAMSVDVTVSERESKEIVDTHVFGAADVHEKVLPLTGLYGLSKVLQDRTSDVKTGPDKLAAMKIVYEQLVAGQWQKERVVGSPTVSANVEALAQFKKCTIPQAQAALRRYDKAQREEIFATPEIAALSAAIKEAREQEEVVSLDDLAGGAPAEEQAA